MAPTGNPASKKGSNAPLPPVRISGRGERSARTPSAAPRRVGGGGPLAAGAGRDFTRVK